MLTRLLQCYRVALGLSIDSAERIGAFSSRRVLQQPESRPDRAALISSHLFGYGKAITAQGKEGIWGRLFIRWRTWGGPSNRRYDIQYICESTSEIGLP